MKYVSRVVLGLAAAGALLFALAGSAGAAPISSGQAESLVRHWLERSPNHLGRALSTSVAGVDTYTDPAGVPLYHVVSLAPKGFVVVSADDRVEPIICFSANGVFDTSGANPIAQLIGRDVSARITGAAAESALRNRDKWQSLLGPLLFANATSETLPPDVWVAPIVQSQWNQGYPSSVECYNFYTPDNDYTGCVATAMAQLMRFWQWPQKAVGNASLPIYINGTPSTLALRGGDGNGGAYDWAQMPLTPDTLTLTTQQYDEVADLSVDAGVAVDMQYGPNGSGAYLSNAQAALVGTFGYSNAIISNSFPSYANLEQQIYPDLDAGEPVVVAINNASEGHCVLADGYGQDSGTFYTHLNVGWGTSADGLYDLWYNLADPDITNYGFNTISQTIYNVCPQGSGETISGMVLSPAGAFVPGVTVTIVGGGVSLSTTSSALHGIYAFTNLPSNTTYSISATYQGQTQSITATTGASGNYSSCGNLWAQNLQFANAAAVPQFSPAAGTYASAQTVQITDATPGSTIYYTIDGTTPTTMSPVYNSALTTVSSGAETIRAIADAPSYAASAPVSAAYTINNPAPTLSSISPASAMAGAEQFTLTVNGSGFVPSSSVKWNGSALSTSFVSATELSAIVPASLITTAGSASVTVYTASPGGGSSSSASFAINNPTPTLSSISPASAMAGASQFTLTVNGSGFVPSSSVKWNGSALSTSFVSATELSAIVPASLITTAGSASVTVYTASPGGGTSSSASFAINNPAPTLSSISPSSATAGAAQFTLTVTGSGFMSGSSVKWNGSALSTSFVSATELSAIVPASLITTAGSASVTVYTASPGGGSSSSASFAINNPAPTLSSISPSSATAGAAQFTLTVTGSGFVSGSSVKWNGSALSTSFVSATELSAIVPASLITTAGSAPVTVYTASPGGGTSSPASFAINNPAPTLSSISPSSATAGAAQFTLTVTGSGFMSGSSVKWNGSALSTSFVSATELSAIVPASLITTAGSASVTVYTASPGGGSSSSASFAINNPAPTLSSISPSSATAGGSQFTLTATGSGFVPNSVIEWNGAMLTSAYVSATELSATVPSGSIAVPGSALVTVHTASPGGGTTAPAVFTVTAPGVVQFTVTASAGEYGSISPSGTMEVGAGSSQQFTATANSGCVVNEWTLDGEVVQSGAPTFTVSDVEANHSVAVSFRRPSRFDFNGDGCDDLLWENSQTRQLALWDMNGQKVLEGTGPFTTLPAGWSVNAVGDINRDGHPDLLLWNAKTGQVACWELNGSAGTTMLAGYNIATAPTQWQPISMADFNGDGKPDILLHNSTTNQLAVWYMNGAALTSGIAFTTVPAGWIVAGTADFNQDGHPDILLQNTKSGALAIWYMGGANGTTILSGRVFANAPSLGLQIVSTGDLNGDGHPDITWRNPATGQLTVWLMGGADGTTIESTNVLPNTPATDWCVVGVR